MKVYMLEMTTLASIGNMPALPLGMKYPKGLFGKPKKSKRIRFCAPKKESQFIVLQNFSERHKRKHKHRRKHSAHKTRVQGANDPLSVFHHYLNRLTASDIGAPEHAISRLGKSRR